MGGGAGSAAHPAGGWGRPTSSYAVDARPVTIEPLVLPAPRPERIHWSTLVLVAGMVICVLGLLATIAGVPGSMGYDVDGAPRRNKPHTKDPLKLSQSLDANMKWIDQSSADTPDGYVGFIKSINRNEGAIGPMVSAVMSMNQSVIAIDEQIGGVKATTIQMRKDMQAMAKVSGASATKMEGLGEDIGFLSKSMLGLADATKELTTKMGAIETKAGKIASGGTSTALASTRELNRTLPEGVPAPVLEPEGAAGGGVGPGESPLANGAQPPRPTAYATGGAL